MLLCTDKYEKLKPHIIQLKKIFSSKYMTSMHASAELNQKWPCLNLVRQVLKRMGYDIHPERKCAGYDDTGKKLFERFFKVHKRPQNAAIDCDNSIITHITHVMALPQK
jgi:Mn-dependent DtxR family transcriptional regulator